MAPKDWDNVTIKIDGTKVNLEDAFEVFEDLFDDVDEAFEHMEEAFGNVDKNISEKVNKLKIKLAAKKPDKYEYIPDEDEDVDKQWEDHMEYRKTAVIRSKRNLHRFMIGATIGMLLVIAGIFLVAVTSEKDKEFGEPSKLDKPAITEKLEPL